MPSNILPFPNVKGGYRFSTAAEFLSFAFSGNATFAIANKSGPEQVVFKIWRMADISGDRTVWSVNHWSFLTKRRIGVMLSGAPPEFSPIRDIEDPVDLKAQETFAALMKIIIERDELPTNALIKPVGRCCRCGRKTPFQSQIYCARCKK